MPRKKVQTASDTDSVKPKDPFLAKIEDWVISVLDSNASPRMKAQAAAIGIKARATRHDITGDEEGGKFFNG